MEDEEEKKWLDHRRCRSVAIATGKERGEEEEVPTWH